MIFKFVFYIYFLTQIKNINSQNIDYENILENKDLSPILLENNFFLKDVYTYCVKNNFTSKNCDNNFYSYLNNTINVYFDSKKIYEFNNIFINIKNFKEILKSKKFYDNFILLIDNLNKKKDFNFISKNLITLNIFECVSYITKNNFDKFINDIDSYEIIENLFLNFFIWSNNEKNNYKYFKDVLFFYKDLKDYNNTHELVDNTVLYLYKIMLNNPNIFKNEIFLKRLFYNYYYKFFDFNKKTEIFIKSLNNTNIIPIEKEFKLNKNIFKFFQYENFDLNIYNEIIKNINITFLENLIFNNINFYIYSNNFNYKMDVEYFEINYGNINVFNDTINIYIYKDILEDISFIPILIKKLYLYNYLKFDLKYIDYWFIESLSKALSEDKSFCLNINNIKYNLKENIKYEEYLLYSDFIDNKIFYITQNDIKELFKFLDNGKINYTFLNNYNYNNINDYCIDNLSKNNIKYNYSKNIKITNKTENLIFEYKNYYVNLSNIYLEFIPKKKKILSYSSNFYIKNFQNSMKSFLFNFFNINEEIFFFKNIILPLNIYDTNFKFISLNNYNIFLNIFIFKLKNDFDFYTKFFINDINTSINNFINFLNFEKYKKIICEKNINKIIIPSSLYKTYNLSYDLILESDINKEKEIENNIFKNVINKNQNTFEDLINRFNYKILKNNVIVKTINYDFNFICYKNKNYILNEKIELNKKEVKNLINDLITNFTKIKNDEKNEFLIFLEKELKLEKEKKNKTYNEFLEQSKENLLLFDNKINNEIKKFKNEILNKINNYIEIKGDEILIFKNQTKYLVIDKINEISKELKNYNLKNTLDNIKNNLENNKINQTLINNLYNLIKHNNVTILDKINKTQNSLNLIFEELNFNNINNKIKNKIIDIVKENLEKSTNEFKKSINNNIEFIHFNLTNELIKNKNISTQILDEIKNNLNKSFINFLESFYKNESSIIFLNTSKILENVENFKNNVNSSILKLNDNIINYFNDYVNFTNYLEDNFEDKLNELKNEIFEFYIEKDQYKIELIHAINNSIFEFLLTNNIFNNNFNNQFDNKIKKLNRYQNNITENISLIKNKIELLNLLNTNLKNSSDFNFDLVINNFISLESQLNVLNQTLNNFNYFIFKKINNINDNLDKHNENFNSINLNLNKIQLKNNNTFKVFNSQLNYIEHSINNNFIQLNTLNSKFDKNLNDSKTEIKKIKKTINKGYKKILNDTLVNFLYQKNSEKNITLDLRNLVTNLNYNLSKTNKKIELNNKYIFYNYLFFIFINIILIFIIFLILYVFYKNM